MCIKNTRKTERNCISWVVIGTKIICTERSQDLIIASIERTNQLVLMQPPLDRGHVLMEWLLLRNNHLFLEDMFKHNYLFRGHATKEQLKLVLMQPPLFRGHVLMELPLEKQPPLFRGHVQTQWPLWRTCNQGTVETCFDATTSIQRTLNWQLLISQEQVGGTILDLDKLKHTELSLVCLGFTLINVPRMLKCPGPSAFRHNQMSGVAFGGHVPWYYALSTKGQWGGTGVRSYTWVLFWGCRDPLSWTTKQV